MVLLCICLFNYILVVFTITFKLYSIVSHTLNTGLSLIDMSKYNLKGGKVFSTLRTNINKNYS